MTHLRLYGIASSTCHTSSKHCTPRVFNSVEHIAALRTAAFRLPHYPNHHPRYTRRPFRSPPHHPLISTFGFTFNLKIRHTYSFLAKFGGLVFTVVAIASMVVDSKMGAVNSKTLMVSGVHYPYTCIPLLMFIRKEKP